MTLPDLAVAGLTVRVVRGPVSEGTSWRYCALPHPVLVIPDGSDEVAARAIFEFLHDQAVRTALPQAVGRTLFGLIRDNPGAFHFMMHCEPPLDAWLDSTALNTSPLGGSQN